MSYYDADSLVRSPEYQAELAAQRSFMTRVYGWMTIGLLVTAFTALVVASTPELVKTIYVSGGFWILIIAELVIALGFGFALRSVPVPVAAAMFIVYSVLTGATLSIVLLIYTASSVAATFFITAGMFAGISAYGYVTKRSLDSIGSFCIMGLWGLIIASVVNIFLRSDGMSWIISIIGVVVFTGLTAYDTQKFKQAYAVGETGSAMNRKIALLGAFALYLDFVNLFIYLLRFLGTRRD
jgi:FtsH-binding integral membrane protein